MKKKQKYEKKWKKVHIMPSVRKEQRFLLLRFFLAPCS